MMRYLGCATIFILAASLSCMSGPQFREIYTFTVDHTPFTDALRMYLHQNYKIGHPFVYGLLTLSLLAVLKRLFVLLAPLLAFCFGVFMEVIQYWVPTRSNNWDDLGRNSLGILVAVVLWLVLLMSTRVLQKIK